MTWTRLPDNFTDRPDILEVSRSARLLHVEALVWCNRQLTNGRLPKGALPRITDSPDPEADVAELLAVELWELDGERGWQLDWSDQEDAESVKGRQAARAQTQKRYRERQAKHAAGDHSLCDPRFCSSAVTGNATGNATSHITGHETPSRPVPSRPVPKGQGQDQEGRPGSAGAPPGDPQGEARQLPLPHHNYRGDCCNLPDHHPVHKSAS